MYRILRKFLNVAQPEALEIEALWSAWSYSRNVDAQGQHKITARATYGQETKESTITITVSLSDSNDTESPTIEIMSPADGSTIYGPVNGVPIKVEGKSSDNPGGSGVKEVVVQIGSASQFQKADPQSANWSAWSSSGHILTTGQHTITARAYDAAGNHKDRSITVTISFTPGNPALDLKRPRLFLIETYRLSSFLGQYGAGRTIKTFSLLPGEKTKISMKTYSKTEEDAKQASSILDSVTNESTKDFETTLAKEQSDKTNYQESSSYEVNAKAEASWGFGSAEISGGVKGAASSSREEFAKNVSNTTQKHASKASAKRDVQINTSYERKQQAGEETSIERELENINVSRTLNFVFRQMNQEFITLLHLTDVRVAFWDGEPDAAVSIRKEVSLPELQTLLDDFVKEPETVRQAIEDQLTSIIDYEGNFVDDFVEEMELKDRTGAPLQPRRKYWRVNPKKIKEESEYTDETGNRFRVPGIILSANKYVMRTDGVIVEALLGQGDALDDYSHGLQDEAIRAKLLNHQLTESEIKKMALSMKIINEGNADLAKVFEQVYPCCQQQVFSLWPLKDDKKIVSDNNEDE
jgi:Big-like domain-containing protein